MTTVKELKEKLSELGDDATIGAFLIVGIDNKKDKHVIEFVDSSFKDS